MKKGNERRRTGTRRKRGKAAETTEFFPWTDQSRCCLGVVFCSSHLQQLFTIAVQFRLTLTTSFLRRIVDECYWQLNPHFGNKWTCLLTFDARLCKDETDEKGPRLAFWLYMFLLPMQTNIMQTTLFDKIQRIKYQVCINVCTTDLCKKKIHRNLCLKKLMQM